MSLFIMPIYYYLVINTTNTKTFLILQEMKEEEKE